MVVGMLKAWMKPKESLPEVPHGMHMRCALWTRVVSGMRVCGKGEDVDTRVGLQVRNCRQKVNNCW